MDAMEMLTSLAWRMANALGHQIEDVQLGPSGDTIIGTCTRCSARVFVSLRWGHEGLSGTACTVSCERRQRMQLVYAAPRKAS